eukprot:Gregarina_sp_Poly_1__1388@NODE_1345_length_4331_cov_47_703565_g903_i0_p2_GENE_NODE_1345_length_4331_cov_47_703565_g903_i0NODE_1345_length_4331_cov_47_703565_g903_i0_p2_ORF_typecomplete_len406_score44_58HSP70/PF00012_20/2_5e10StbA/PF06406_11/0_072Cut8/PF08559_10/0_26_NODE_1345_length_4331_cov_47_703565_g903_i012662483
MRSRQIGIDFGGYHWRLQVANISQQTSDVLVDLQDSTSMRAIMILGTKSGEEEFGSAAEQRWQTHLENTYFNTKLLLRQPQVALQRESKVPEICLTRIFSHWHEVIQMNCKHEISNVVVAIPQEIDRERFELSCRARFNPSKPNVIRESQAIAQSIVAVLKNRELALPKGMCLCIDFGGYSCKLFLFKFRGEKDCTLEAYVSDPLMGTEWIDVSVMDQLNLEDFSCSFQTSLNIMFSPSPSFSATGISPNYLGTWLRTKNQCSAYRERVNKIAKGREESAFNHVCERARAQLDNLLELLLVQASPESGMIEMIFPLGGGACLSWVQDWIKGLLNKRDDKLPNRPKIRLSMEPKISKIFNQFTTIASGASLTSSDFVWREKETKNYLDDFRETLNCCMKQSLTTES